MSLPNWFILQAPPNLEIDIRLWKQLAMNRVKMLESLTKNPSQVIRDNFPDYDEEIERIYDDYRLGAYLLRLVAATNRRLEAWLIESEGDLFEYLYHDRTDSRAERAAAAIIQLEHSDAGDARVDATPRGSDGRRPIWRGIRRAARPAWPALLLGHERTAASGGISASTCLWISYTSRQPRSSRATSSSTMAS